MAGKMDQTMIIVSTIVGSLGLLSAILGFSAEGTKLTVSDLLWGDGVCYYPHNPALALGVCAVIFLIIAQVTFAVVGGCCGYCKSRAMPSETNRIIGIVCAIVSWIAAVIAFGLLVQGAALNATGAREASALGLCYVLKDGIFAGAGVLTLAATALGLTSYILLRTQPGATAAAPKTEGGEQVPAGIAMGQPQFPQQSPPQGYRQMPPPNYPQYSPPPQGTYGQALNGQFPPPPHVQGYGAHAPNQQFPPPPPQGYGAHAPNQQYTPPAQGYGAYAPNQQFPPASPPPSQGYGPAHAPNQQAPPPKGHGQE